MGWKHAKTAENNRTKNEFARSDPNNPAFANFYKLDDATAQGFEANLDKWVQFVSFCR